MNNKEKNTYVKKQITTALLKMLETQSLATVSIRDIANEAGVGRASFYRNYESKEDVLRQHTVYLTRLWGKEFESNPDSSVFNVFGSLFEHYRKNKEFYMLLYRENLSYLILDTIREICGPKAEMTNQEAYGKAFFAYGLYGWIDEWIARGMQESAEELNAMLNQNNGNQNKE
ncbi:MAG: TetR/AcrR family transcriptional regulator [Lachnospiraceae bacterium]